MNKAESFMEDLLLMGLNIEAQKQEFLTICRASIQREGIEDLLAWLLFQIWNKSHYPRKTIIREESRNAA